MVGLESSSSSDTTLYPDAQSGQSPCRPHSGQTKKQEGTQAFLFMDHHVDQPVTIHYILWDTSDSLSTVDFMQGT